MSSRMDASIGSTRPRVGLRLALLAALAMGLGACSGTMASNLPTLPSVELPTLPPGGAGSACLDQQTLAILDQLKATGADVPALLAANKDKLIAGLNQLQPTDSAVVTWRDALVAAIRSDNAQVVATQVALLANGQVSIPAC
jgi:ABC-type phosphate/phosphonate transport system substrate-binding protein